MRFRQWIGVWVALFFVTSLAVAQEHPQAEKAARAQTVTCAVCGMTMSPSQAGAKTTYKGKTYYFCSPAEKAKFEKNPETYLSRPKQTQSPQNRMGRTMAKRHGKRVRQTAAWVIDPVCGMKVNPKTAKYSTTYKGHTYYFCAKGDLEKFKKKPSAYVK